MQERKDAKRKKTEAEARLSAYKAKRDFAVTPEPAGTSGGHTGERLYCVQKHMASRLHYDFRLEHHGVLLSWAVPKGPSLRPSDKRLAMRVEDHPREYGDFEGVIPEGYGAGIVMLWDRGTWEPEGNVDRALKKGELKFKLNGVKLKGSWVLVRTSPPDAIKQSWLLIKHRDEWAGDVDIAEFAPLSVKSNFDLKDILSNDPSVWQSHMPKNGTATAFQTKLKNFMAEKSTAETAPGKSTATARAGKKPHKKT